MDNGYIKLHRSIHDHWIWQDPVKFQWWVDILMVVNHTGSKVNLGMQLIECKRGQSVMSLSTWAARWRVSKDKVRNFFVLLEKDGMILHENVGKSTRITVCNYDIYQCVLHASQTQAKRKPNAMPTQTSNEELIKNNDKGIKDIRDFPLDQKNLIPTEESEKEKSSGKKENYDLAFVVSEFLPIMNDWLNYKADKKQGYKNQQSVEACYRKLHGFSHGDPRDARFIIDDAMANNYSGFFELKTDKNGKTTNSRASKEILGDPAKRTTTIPSTTRN